MVEDVHRCRTHWERYYRSGAVATGPGGPDGGYVGVVRTLWVDYFGTLPDGACIVDIGTGNGAIVEIALHVARHRGVRFDVHGVDIAAIDPFRDVPAAAGRLHGAHFHPCTPAERLPFASASVDAASGHYALEYTDMAATLAELARVLRAGASARFVLHHAESRLAASARADQQQFADLLDTIALPAALRALFDVAADDAAGAQAAGMALRDAIRALKQRHLQQDGDPFGRPAHIALDAARQLLELRNRAGPALARAEIARLESDWRAGQQRLADLIAHALDASQFAALLETAVRAGFTVGASGVLYDENSALLGWQLALTRADGER